MKRRNQTRIINAALYRNPYGFNDTGCALVTEIPVEAIGNDELERVFNHELNAPNTGRWMPNASQVLKKKGKNHATSNRNKRAN